MEYRPDGPEPMYKLTLPNTYKDKVDGYCGDFDEDVDDEINDRVPNDELVE